MGTWNGELFGNDTASDIRESYLELLCDCYSDEQAYEMLLKEYEELIGSDEESIFWYAIAATQWGVGRLMLSVKEKALYWIENNGGIELWNDTVQNQEQWKKTLSKLKNVLISQMPGKKEFKKEVFEKNPWNIGDVYAYRFHKKCSQNIDIYGKYILLHKIADDTSQETASPRIQVYNKIFDTLPTSEQIDNLTVLPIADAELYFKTPCKDRIPLPFNIVVIREKKIDYVEKHFTYIGNIQDKFFLPTANFNLSNCYWFEIEELICEFLPSWSKFDYSVSNGNVKVFKK